MADADHYDAETPARPSSAEKARAAVAAISAAAAAPAPSPAVEAAFERAEAAERHAQKLREQLDTARKNLARESAQKSSLEDALATRGREMDAWRRDAKRRGPNDAIADRQKAAQAAAAARAFLAQVEATRAAEAVALSENDLAASALETAEKLREQFDAEAAMRPKKAVPDTREDVTTYIQSRSENEKLPPTHTSMRLEGGFDAETEDGSGGDTIHEDYRRINFGWR